MSRMTASMAVRLSEQDYERILDQIMCDIKSTAVMAGRELRFSDKAFVAHIKPDTTEGEQSTLIRNIICDLRQLGYVVALRNDHLRIQW